MSRKRILNVDDAYALKTPADSIRLYGDWAETYDRDFVDNVGYVSHLRIADLLLRQQSLIKGAVLDVANGTITEPEIVEIKLYSEETNNLEHADDTALVVVCQIV